MLLKKIFGFYGEKGYLDLELDPKPHFGPERVDGLW